MKKKLEELLRALAASPNDVQLLQKIAELYQKLRDDRNAAIYFDRIAEFYSHDGYFLKAVALSKQDRPRDVTRRLFEGG